MRRCNALTLAALLLAVPALVVDGQIKSTGKVPDVAAIKSMLAPR